MATAQWGVWHRSSKNSSPRLLHIMLVPLAAPLGLPMGRINARKMQPLQAILDTGSSSSHTFNPIVEAQEKTPALSLRSFGPEGLEEQRSEMYNRDIKLMRDLNVGDRVAVGKNVYSVVYAFGHKDAHTTFEFVQVHRALQNMLELTAGHFVPIEISGKLVYKRAENLKVGDILWKSSQITGTSKVEKLGLYNPLTLSGNIMVNNVLASSSCHVQHSPQRDIMCCD
ncbi:warthog protein 6 [Selaginella moellendorffii]|uniref:warthog protein 6 n=1 Tax=Selaginella moellendorffii TaxID=88036 RepID=UPI000D1CDDFD|nr:warthog protein 6 [Selaginella moellendorffii]|eukprot:XP_024520585.1 warthog protein 6 [Selaginella moellendorffii]